MKRAGGSNKGKMAKRVVEVLEFFDQPGRKATSTSIARHFGQPRSSTADLLSALVEFGLLYRDSRSRVYTPTPRLASIGTDSLPELALEGRLFPLMDYLAQTTRKSVMLFGMVGMRVQIFHRSPGGVSEAFYNKPGSSKPLLESAVGLLLLSTLPSKKVSRVLWRLNAELPAPSKINLATTEEKIALFRRQNHAIGQAGFNPGLQVAATLLPNSETGHPLALGTFLAPQSPIDAMEIIAKLNAGFAFFKARHKVDNQDAAVRFRMVS